MRNELQELLLRDGVASRTASWLLLPGGVSSDVYRVEDAGRTFIVKRALPQLRVQQEWLADVSRNQFEQRYLQYVGAFLPHAVPRVLATGDGYFVMEDLGPGFVNWKSQLLSGRGRPEDARVAGDILGQIHAHSYHDPVAARDFDCPKNFLQLRVEPYLLATARSHPIIAQRLRDEANRLLATREALVHGDFSPKNLLVGEKRVVVIDCEVAWYGDPAFDMGFLISHLLLKSGCQPKIGDLAKMVEAFRQGYAEARGADFAYERQFDRRVANLLPMLLLARVDGKSPVEYLSARRREMVRKAAVDVILANADCTSAEICQQWLSSFHAF